jgi:hypothetical protein
VDDVLGGGGGFTVFGRVQVLPSFLKGRDEGASGVAERFMEGTWARLMPEGLCQSANGFVDSGSSKVLFITSAPLAVTKPLEEGGGETGSDVLTGDLLEQGIVGEAEVGEMGDPASPGAVFGFQGGFNLSVEDAGNIGAIDESQQRIALGRGEMSKVAGTCDGKC